MKQIVYHIEPVRCATKGCAARSDAGRVMWFVVSKRGRKDSGPHCYDHAHSIMEENNRQEAAMASVRKAIAKT